MRAGQQAFFERVAGTVGEHGGNTADVAADHFGGKSKNGAELGGAHLNDLFTVLFHFLKVVQILAGLGCSRHF